jgi:hypothetical protein
VGRIPPHPGVFLRVANKGDRGYQTWKCVRKRGCKDVMMYGGREKKGMEDESATEPPRRRAKEERGWLVSNKWLTIITTPFPVF